MSQQELLKQVIATLERLNIDYMVTGSIASSMQGEPRSSHDIDVVVNLPASAIPRLLKSFPPPDYYLAESAIRDAIQAGSMFNLLHVAEGEKVDFWILTEEPYDQSRFARRRREPALGSQLYVSAPEDTILMKLRWYKLAGGSEKQFTDALRVYEVQRELLDIGYLRDWATKLGIADLLERIVAYAEGA
jgi:hypothetical protein